MRNPLRQWFASSPAPGGREAPPPVPFPESGLALPPQFAWYLACRSRASRLIEWSPNPPTLSIWHCDWPCDAQTPCIAPDAPPILSLHRQPCKLSSLDSMLRSESLAQSVVHVSGLDRLSGSGLLFETLRHLSRHARYLVLDGEVPIPGFDALCHDLRIPPSFVAPPPLRLALAGREAAVPAVGKPAKALALMTTYNEVDIVEQAISSLFAQDLDVFVLDDGSTDGTLEILEAIARSTPRMILDKESRKAACTYDRFALLNILLDRANRAAGNGYEWIMHLDADELRCSPWPDIPLAEAFAHVESFGYNAVDFTVIDFRYAKGQHMTSAPYEDQMQRFEFGLRPGHFLQIKAWRHSPQFQTELFPSRGHEVVFEGRRVFPLKFLLKHYPLRGPEHARKKIYRDRFPRYDPEEVAKGAHVQYSIFRNREPDGWEVDGLPLWDDGFHSRFLLERLSGIGLNRSR